MFFDKKEDFQKMNVFIDDSRKLLDENNLSVSEYIFKENQWIINDE